MALFINYCKTVDEVQLIHFKQKFRFAVIFAIIKNEKFYIQIISKMKKCNFSIESVMLIYE